MDTYFYHGAMASPDRPIKGRLRLPGQGVDLPFNLFRETEESLYGTIANVKLPNTFYKKAGWVFEPDQPPLPTEPGFYAPKVGISDDGSLIPDYTIYGLTSRGEWTMLRSGSSTHTPVAIRRIVETSHVDGDLVRVKIVRAD